MYVPTAVATASYLAYSFLQRRHLTQSPSFAANRIKDWKDVCQRAQPQQPTTYGVMQLETGSRSSYEYLGRDFVTSEDIWDALCRRWTIERWILRIRRPSTVEIIHNMDHKNTTDVVLQDYLKFFTILPIRIQWKGEMEWSSGCNNEQITLKSVKMRLGWRCFGHDVTNLKSVEAKRGQPWDVLYDASSPSLIVFHRRGHGRLVYRLLENNAGV